MNEKKNISKNTFGFPKELRKNVMKNGFILGKKLKRDRESAETPFFFAN